MANLIRNMNVLKKTVNVATNKAIQDTAKEAENELRKCIDDQYYKDPDFYPNIYERTEEFLRHATSQILLSNTAEIYVDIKGMHYKNNFSPWQVVKWASESKHGADYYQTSTTDFWTQFIDWCNTNLLNIFKKNLKKNGLNIK